MPFAFAAAVLVALVLVGLLVRTARRAGVLRARIVDLEGRATAVEAARDQAESARAAAEARADEAGRARDDAQAAAADADQRAAAAEARTTEAEEQAASAEHRATTAEDSVTEAATLAVRLIDDGSADPAALWALERARTERTWRHSVAAVAGDPSPLVGARHPLWTALEIEVAAVREEVGAVVDLDVDLPDAVTAGASLATLRVAQELLAAAARKGEVTTLRVSTDGADVLVAVESVDGEGDPIELATLAIPPSRLEPDPGGVRLRGALAAPVDQPA